MSFNLIDAAKSLFTNELVGKASSLLGESESGVTKAMSGILPTVLSGLLNKTSSHEGAEAVSQMVSEQPHSGILDNIGGLLSNDGGGLLTKGAGMLSGLFGNKTDGIAGLISNFSGIKSSSAGSLLSMALPAVLALIGKHTGGNGASGITSLLSSQKDNIAAAMPAGLNLSSILGNVGGLSSVTSNAAAATATNYTTDTVKKSGGGTSYILPLIIGLLALIAAGYFFKDGCNGGSKTDSHGADSTNTTTEKISTTTTENTVTMVAGTVDSLTGNFVYNIGKMVTIDLPNGAGKLDVGEFSTENKLYKFLSDASATVDTAKGNWFEFTNVKFKTGGSEISDESMAQLKNMVAITKGYPTAQFKIGGYTDNSGNAASNVTLSQKRADAVAAMLTKLGAAPASFTGTKGYGPEWPLADNATAEGRAQNRRVAVNVKAK